MAGRRQAFFEVYSYLDTIPLDDRILERAALPVPTMLGSLDAIHLASAIMWQGQTREDFFFATHVGQLGIAARAAGLDVIGV